MRLRFALPVGLLLLVIAVAAFAPARLVDLQLAQASDGRLRLADAAGTVWRGDGIVTDARGALRLPVSLAALAAGALSAAGPRST